MVRHRSKQRQKEDQFTQFNGGTQGVARLPAQRAFKHQAEQKNRQHGYQHSRQAACSFQPHRHQQRKRQRDNGLRESDLADNKLPSPSSRA